MQFNRKGISDAELLDLYKAIIKPRLIEEKMLILLRQGKISKWFSGIGQEAISVGLTYALDQDEYILPMHRNLGVFTHPQCHTCHVFGSGTVIHFGNVVPCFSDVIINSIFLFHIF